ncbi:MAG: deoxyuridine 5'-triphosphate nucleotidohydrolase [Candidatus Bathyarchaeota archaeon]
MKSKSSSSYFLTGDEILEGIKASSPLIKDFIDLKEQLQPAGFEMTLSEIQTFEDSGSIDFTNKSRKLAKTKKIGLKEGSPTTLPAGAYTLRYNETVHLPKNILALIFPRSSLIRNGAVLYTAVWDPGYEGKGQGLLCIHNQYGLKIYKNARIGQMVFIKLGKSVAEGYRGIYTKEKVCREAKR